MPRFPTSNGKVLTPVQRLLYERMKDGNAHPKDSLAKVIDDLADSNNLHVHISYLRTALRRFGIGIRTEMLDGSTSYRFVRLLPPSDR